MLAPLTGVHPTIVIACLLIVSFGRNRALFFNSMLCRATPTGGKTPLHAAAYKGHAAMCRVLVDFGASTSATDKGVCISPGKIHVPRAKSTCIIRATLGVRPLADFKIH